MSDYKLIDSGDGLKLEQFGSFQIIRPCVAANWARSQRELWQESVGRFLRDGHWEGSLPTAWSVELEGIQFGLSPRPCGQLGLFPEQAPHWRWVRENAAGLKILNLFAYTGGMTLAAAQGGAEVCHVDASSFVVGWARENAMRNGLAEAPIRWIVDDVFKFLNREIKRGRTYDGIVLDPPTFGRGAKGEVFKLERDVDELLALCRVLLKPKPAFLLLSCHTPVFSPSDLGYLLDLAMEGLEGEIEAGELFLGKELPSGTFARWISPVLKTHS